MLSFPDRSGATIQMNEGGRRMASARTWLRGGAFCLAGGLAALVGACAAPPPPPPPPTIVQAKLVAAKDVNPTQGGAAAPVVVRVYQLASAAGFEKAEFFRLLNADTATLGPDLIKKDEYLMAPGTTKEESMTLPDRVKAIGVIAAYREFQSKTWRITIPAVPNKTTPVTITAGASGLAVAP